MPLRKYFLVLLMSYFSEQVQAQDSLRTFFEKKEVAEKVITEKKPRIKFTADIDQRFTLIKTYNSNDATNVNVWGIRVGLYFPKGYKVGLGYYFLKQQSLGIKIPSVKLKRDIDCPDCYAQRKLNFGTVYFEPFWIRREYWELSTPLELGYGIASEYIYRTFPNTTRADTEIKALSQDGDFFPAGLGVSLSGKLPALRGLRGLRWFGLNGLVGYRHVLKDNLAKEDFDGVFYSISLAFFLDRFTDDLRDWRVRKKLRKEKQ